LRATLAHDACAALAHDACVEPPAFVYPFRMHSSQRLPAVSLVLLPLASLFGLAALLVASLGPLDRLEGRLYDRYLGLSGPGRSPAGLLVIAPGEGDEAEEWSEEEARSALRLLGELGARSVAVADSDFGRPSASGRLDYLRSSLPPLVDAEYETIERNLRGLFDAMRAGTLPPKELGRNVDLLAAAVRESGERLKLAAAGEEGVAAAAPDPAWPPLVARGAFVGAKPDSDGALRGLLLAREKAGKLIPSYELASLMDYLGSPALEEGVDCLVLRGCTFPDLSSRDLVLPVDGERRLRLGWPRPGSSSAPRLLALAELRAAVREEASLVADLKKLEDLGALGAEGAVLLSRYRRAELLRSELSLSERGSGSPRSAADWRDAREAFFVAALAYFREAASVPPAAPAPAAASVEGAAADTAVETAALRGECLELARSLEGRRKSLAEALNGAFVFFSPRDARPPLGTIYGGRTSAAEAGAVLAAAALEGRVSVAGPSAFRAAVALLLAFVALCLAALAIVLGRRRRTDDRDGADGRPTGSGLLSRADVLSTSTEVSPPALPPAKPERSSERGASPPSSRAP
jgi:hypothetical protein